MTHYPFTNASKPLKGERLPHDRALQYECSRQGRLEYRELTHTELSPTPGKQPGSCPPLPHTTLLAQASCCSVWIRSLPPFFRICKDQEKDFAGSLSFT